MFNSFHKKTNEELVVPKLVANFLKKKIKCKNGYLPENYAKVSDFNKIQEGYRYNGMTGESFVSDKKGKWNTSWYVIAQNEMDDPYFVNFEEEHLGFPVYFAWHGTGIWEAIEVISSIEQFVSILGELNKLTPPCTLDFLADKVDLSNEFWAELADDLSYNEDDDE